jgi:hypothetical protein
MSVFKDDGPRDWDQFRLEPGRVFQGSAHLS